MRTNLSLFFWNLILILSLGDNFSWISILTLPSSWENVCLKDSKHLFYILDLLQGSLETYIYIWTSLEVSWWLDRFPQWSTQCNDGWPGPHSLSNKIGLTCAIICSLGSMYSVFYWHLIVTRLIHLSRLLHAAPCLEILLHCQHDLLTSW